MAKGEHDKVDERLIIHGPRRSKPSEKAIGKAYPKTVMAGSPSSITMTNEQPVLRKCKLLYQENTNEIPNTHLASLKINTESRPPASLENPLGDAVNPDGSLKDARDIKWFHSPSDETVPLAVPTMSALHVKSNVRDFYL